MPVWPQRRFPTLFVDNWLSGNDKQSADVQFSPLRWKRTHSTVAVVDK